MTEYKLGEVSALLAGILGIEPEEVSAWGIIVTVEGKGHAVATDNNNEYNSPDAAMAANMYYLSDVLRGMLKHNYVEEVEVDEAIAEQLTSVASSVKFVCIPCKDGNHSFCQGNCDCQHRWRFRHKETGQRVETIDPQMREEMRSNEEWEEL